MAKRQISTEAFMQSLSTQPRIGGLYRLSKGIGSVSVANAKTYTDEMKASATICTPVVDRQEEVILPIGIQLNDYDRNPVVLFEHGEGGINKPIATSRSPATRKLSVRINEDEASADSWFYDASLHPESAQMFALIDADVIRATSIQAMPTSTAQYHTEGGFVPVTETCELIEWSWCVLGVNPTTLKKSWIGNRSSRDQFIEAVELQNEAASRVLGLGRLNGDRLLPMVAKSLKSITRRTETYGVGANFDLENEMQKSLTEQEVAALSPLRRKSLLTRLADFDVPTRALLKSYGSDSSEEEEEEEDEEAGAGEDGAESTESTEEGEATEGDEDAQKKSNLQGGDEAGDEDEDMQKKCGSGGCDDEKKDRKTPAGAMLVKNVYDSTKFLAEWMEDELGPIENPAVRETLNEVLTKSKSDLALYEGLYADQYSDFGPISGDEKKKKKSKPVEGVDGEESEDNEFVTQMKSIISSSKSEKFKFRGLEERVRVLAKSVVGPQRKSLGAIRNELNRLADDMARFQDTAKAHVKSLKSMVPLEQHQELQRKFNLLDQQVNELLKAT